MFLLFEHSSYITAFKENDCQLQTGETGKKWLKVTT